MFKWKNATYVTSSDPHLKCSYTTVARPRVGKAMESVNNINGTYTVQ